MRVLMRFLLPEVILLTRSEPLTTIPPLRAAALRCGSVFRRPEDGASGRRSAVCSSPERGRGMRQRRWLVIGSIGLTACLLAGCLRNTAPPEAPRVRSDLPARGTEEPSDV